MRSTAHLELSVEVAASAAKTFDYFTDWPRQGEWMLGTRVEPRASGHIGMGRGNGAVIAGFTGIGPIGFWDTMTITEWIDDHKVFVVHTGRVVRGTGEMRVDAVSDTACRFVWIEDLDLPWGSLGAFGFALLRPMFEGAVNVSLRRFAKRVPHV